MMHACIYKYSPFSHTTHECTMIVLPLGHSKITDNRPHPPFPANKGPPPLWIRSCCLILFAVIYAANYVYYVPEITIFACVKYYQCY